MTISVVIPTLNEAQSLPRVLAVLAGEPQVSEIIIADGGSHDDTVAIARAAGANVILAEKGRGQQTRAGAELARGAVLWFLHADTVPERGAGAAILRALATNPEAPGGNFHVIFDGGSDFARWLTSFYAWLRSHSIYYGDSAIFVRSEVYRKLGGIQATALMEDFEFVRKMEKTGPTLNIKSVAVHTSSRRFENRKPWRIVAQWLVIHALYFCNVSGERLARFYKSAQHAPAREK